MQSIVSKKVKSLKCCVEIFIRGNVWGAPLSGQATARVIVMVEKMLGNPGKDFIGTKKKLRGFTGFPTIQGRVFLALGDGTKYLCFCGYKIVKFLPLNLGVTDAWKNNFFTVCIPSSPFSRSNIKCDYSNVSHYLNINSLGALHADKHVYSIGWHTCILGEPTSKSE